MGGNMRLHASFLLFFLLGIELALDLRQSVLASIPRDFHGPCHSDWSSKSAATAAAYASTHFSNDFQCLSDSTPYTSQILDSGQCRGYHWTLSNFSAIRNSVDQRHFTILLSPCHGNPSLYARPLMGFPSSKEGDFWYSANQTRVHFNHTRGTTNELRLPMQWSDVFISVCSSQHEWSNYTISIHPNDASVQLRIPKPTHPEITAQHVGKGTLVVSFEPLPLFSGANISYQLYFREVPPDSSPAVIENNACAQKRNGSSCIMWTACGLQNVGIAGPIANESSILQQWGGIVPVPVNITINGTNGTKITKLKRPTSDLKLHGLQIGKVFFLNVVVRKTVGNHTFYWSYNGVQGETEYNRITTLVKDESNFVVGGTVIGVVIGTIFFMFFLKVVLDGLYKAYDRQRLDAYHRKHFKHRYKDYKLYKDDNLDEIASEKAEVLARNIDAGSGGATSTAQSEASAVDMAVGGGREGSQGSIGERGDPKKKVKARLKAARSALDDDDFKDF